MKTDFHITKTSRKSDTNFLYKERINYIESLEKLSKSKSVLDIVADGQFGLTLRPLEALYFRKKLITNDKLIVERDFYRKENIFILGYDDIRDLKCFLNTPFEDINEEILEKYDFNRWISKFKIGKSKF